jgi:hypothetical protein
MVGEKAPMLGKNLDTSAGFGRLASMRFRAPPPQRWSPAQCPSMTFLQAPWGPKAG